MTTYTVNGKPFEFDEVKTYLDFFIDHGVPQLMQIDFAKMLAQFASGTLKPDEVVHILIMLDRWVAEAPRKRFYRGMVKDGAHVLSGEFWFADDPDGEQIINNLENTGQLARRILETFLPAVAERCKQHPHPATAYFIDP